MTLHGFCSAGSAPLQLLPVSDALLTVYVLQEALSVLEVSDLLGSLTGRAAVSKLLDTAAGLLSYYTNAREAAQLLSMPHGQDNGATILTQLLLKVANNKLPARSVRHMSIL